MILNLQPQANPEFPYLATILSNGRAKDVGVRDSAHLKKRLFELNPYLVMSEEEFSTMMESWTRVCPTLQPTL
jgi:hypothetical protein